MTQNELQPLPLGTMIRKRYTVAGIVGRGGLGTVYRVEETLFGKKMVYAVKELVDQSRGARKQFSQEAKWLQALNHPHIPKVHEYFEWEGRAYLVMDFIDGENLEQKLNRQGGRPLPEDEVMRWILPICDALNYLHRREPPILHRDVKPANIIVSPDGHPVLVDLGIAKEHQPGANKTATFIRKAGTEGYAPPEQYTASGAGPWSDVYALGATLYELLTGCLPPTAVERVALETPLMPPRTVNPNISAHVSDALVNALAMRPSDRFQYVADFASALLGPNDPATTSGLNGHNGLPGLGSFSGSDPRGVPARPFSGARSGVTPISAWADPYPSTPSGRSAPGTRSWPTAGTSGASGTGASASIPTGAAPSGWHASQPDDFARSNILAPSAHVPRVSPQNRSSASLSARALANEMNGIAGAVAVADPPRASRRRWLLPAVIAVMLVAMFGAAIAFRGPLLAMFQRVDQTTPQATINGYFSALRVDNDALAWQYSAANKTHTQTQGAFEQGLVLDDQRLGRVVRWTIVQVTPEDPNDDIATVRVWRADSMTTPITYTLTLTDFNGTTWLISTISAQ